MQIQYVGHSCFFLTTDNGTRIIIDPYDDSIGLTPIHKEADIVLITHHHHDHDGTDGITGSYVEIDAPGHYTEKGVEIHGLEVDHDDRGGAERGKVTAYVIQADGLRLVHLGDIGTMPEDSFFEALGGPVDLLMVPVGGHYTVDAAGAFDLTEKIGANVTIPMHYKTNRLKVDVAPVTGFMDLVKTDYDIQRQGGDLYEIQPNDRKKRGRIVLMENSY